MPESGGARAEFHRHERRGSPRPSKRFGFAMLTLSLRRHRGLGDALEALPRGRLSARTVWMSSAGSGGSPSSACLSKGAGPGCPNMAPLLHRLGDARLGATVAPSPISMCDEAHMTRVARRGCPHVLDLLPEMPPATTMMQLSDLPVGAIWTRLSIVLPRRGAWRPWWRGSIVTLATISTSSPISTVPICGSFVDIAGPDEGRSRRSEWDGPEVKGKQGAKDAFLEQQVGKQRVEEKIRERGEEEEGGGGGKR